MALVIYPILSLESEGYIGVLYVVVESKIHLCRRSQLVVGLIVASYVVVHLSFPYRSLGYTANIAVWLTLISDVYTCR